MKKISVIVPVYNAKKYIKKCLDSLVKQTLKDIEIIVVNDCSLDNVEKILDKYKAKYKNVKIYTNRKNKGIGYTRNLGIKKAKGEYISFVDSDDYLDKNYYEKMYLYAKENELDMVVSDIKKVNETYDVIGYERVEDFEISNLKTNYDLLLNINLGPTNKLYKRELFTDVLFPEDLKYEDLAILPKLISKANKMGKVNGVYYNYLIHSNSETTSMNPKVIDILRVMNIVNSDLKKLSYYKKIKEYVEYLNIRTITRYTLQQKYQENKKTKKIFINAAFEYLNFNFPNWKNNKIFKRRNIIKRKIESSIMLTKLYCSIFKA